MELGKQGIIPIFQFAREERSTKCYKSDSCMPATFICALRRPTFKGLFP